MRLRPAGMTLAGLALAALTAAAQPPAGAPAAPPPPAADPARLDAHLQGWQKRMGELTNFRAAFDLTKTEPVFKRPTQYDGVVLCMKPALARLRVVSKNNPNDYEAYICDGKSIYAYSGLQKEVTQVDLPKNPADGGGNLMLDFLSGMKADDAKRRFNITLFKEDANYVYLDIRPVLARDKEEFSQVRFALFGPGNAGTLPYLPAQIYLARPDGETHLWTFGKQEVNLAEVKAADFQYVAVPGFPLRKAPLQGAPATPPPGGVRPLPGGTGLPAGPGAVKP